MKVSSNVLAIADCLALLIPIGISVAFGEATGMDAWEEAWDADSHTVYYFNRVYVYCMY